MTALFQHYLPPASAMLPYVSGRFYASQHARAVGGAVAMTANRLYWTPRKTLGTERCGLIRCRW